MNQSRGSSDPHPNARVLALELADIVVFYDPNFPKDHEASIYDPPVNRVAVVVGEEGALTIGRRLLRSRVELIPLAVLPRLPSVQVRRVAAPCHVDAIARFFRRHAKRATHFEGGLRALRQGNLQPLVDGGFFPEQRSYRDEATYETEWQRLVGHLQPGDWILTRDRESALSRFIAWATDGLWSHVAMHLGDGEIFEWITSGPRQGSIDLYKGRRYSVGVYRLASGEQRSSEEWRAAMAALTARLKHRYGYWGAFKAGVLAFRGQHMDALTPNSDVLRGNLTLIDFV